MNIIEKYDKGFAYSGIFLNLLLAYQCYRLWHNPGLEDAEKIYSLAILLAFEFVMVHSGVFMAVMSRKITLLILAPLYLLFAFAFNASAPNNIVLITYLIVIFNRMRFAFTDVSEEIKSRAVFTSVLAVIIYFFLLMIVAFNNESIDAHGLTEEFLSASNYNNIKQTGGIFLDTPQVALCFGVWYYILLSVSDYFLLNANFKKKSANITKEEIQL